MVKPEDPRILGVGEGKRKNFWVTVLYRDIRRVYTKRGRYLLRLGRNISVGTIFRRLRNGSRKWSKIRGVTILDIE